ncbi:phosphoenolpyruvate carboxylase [Candidatus Woesearchaeota archaeon]|nr:phosphoenolpyruvate carboxylase [Candidatus Woesearchaeota archaeon]
MLRVSRCMSTQHPDNVTIPFFAGNPELSGDDEVKEAFYTYSHIKCREQLWDCEGKEVDSFVIKKLLSSYEPYFRRNRIGRDIFLTLRVPNPSVERSEAKILLETLESIPRNFDAARLFYGEDTAPIFEVTVPMTTSSLELIRVAEYYKRHVVGKQESRLVDGDITIGEWIGDFRPPEIRVIPLIEDKDTLLSPEKVVGPFMESQSVEGYQRVWLARSDPALNYGNLATVLMLKVALQRLSRLEESSSVSILPILGCGSAPFRGNFKPTNIQNCIQGYPSVYTYTLQSAFRYDYDIGKVASAVSYLNDTSPGKPVEVDEERCVEIIGRLTDAYKSQVALLVDSISHVAPFIPSRRKRKLHIGLFGYSRSVGNLKLPRAITFCAALYSYGLPPEILGLNALTGRDIDYIRGIYVNFDNDLRDSLMFLNEGNLRLFPREVVKAAESAKGMVEFEPDERHAKVTSIIADDLGQGRHKVLSENITRAGFIRGFLG